MSKLSIVIPVYYNQDNLKPLYEDIRQKLSPTEDFDYELVMVDDGSGDDSWAVMQALAAADERVKIIRLSRNFGSHAAILCGLSHADGDCAAVKAADMQEPTEMLMEMYHSWQSGNNVVLAVRQKREDKKTDGFFANAYYRAVKKFALPSMPERGFDTYLLDRKVIEVIERMDERNSALTCQILWAGFKTDRICYTRRAREIGRSRWTLRKKIRLFSDTFFSFTSLPITLVSLIGTLSFIGSLIWALVVLIMRLSGRIAVSGYTTLMIFSLFSFGVTMLTLGLLGGYLWRCFDASRKRPVYIVEREGGGEHEKR